MISTNIQKCKGFNQLLNDLLTLLMNSKGILIKMDGILRRSLGNGWEHGWEDIWKTG